MENAEGRVGGENGGGSEDKILVLEGTGGA